MTTPPKINLGSLLNKPASDIEENEPEIVKDKKYILSKTNLSKEDVENLNEEQFNEVLKIIETSVINKKESTPELTETNVNKKLEESDKNDKGEKNEIKKDEELDELFANYKSDFKKDEHSIFNDLKEKRSKIREKLRMPKTRTGLIMVSLTITIIIIASLFIFFPEKHSLSIYKADILSIKDKYISGPWINENIELNGFVFEISTQKTFNVKKYKYKAVIYSSKEDLNTFLLNEIKIGKELTTKKEAEALRIKTRKIIKVVLENKYNK